MQVGDLVKKKTDTTYHKNLTGVIIEMGWDTGGAIGSTARLTFDVYSGKMVWKDMSWPAANEAAVWDWSSGTHLQLHPDNNRVILAADGAATQKATLDTATDALGFEDINTVIGGTPIYLSDPTYNTMAADIQSGNSAGSIAGAIHGALLGGTGYAAVSGGVLKGGVVTATATPGLVVTVSASVYTYRGRRYEEALNAAAATILDNSTQYCYYNPGTQTYAFDAAIALDNDTRIFLAKVTSLAGSITEIVSCKQMVSRSDHRVDITVGDNASAGDYFRNFTNFNTLGEALAAIAVWANSPNTSRAYTIHIVSDTAESSVSASGLQQPYPIPVDGLRIVGHVGSANRKCNWVDPNALIDLNGKTGTYIQNVDFRWTNSSAAHGTDVAYSVFTATGVTAWTATLEGCRALSGGTTTLEAFYFANTANQGASNDLTIRNCYAEVTNTAVYTSGANTAYGSIHVDNCEFLHSSLTAGATNQHAAIYVDKADRIKVTNTTIGAFGSGFTAGIQIAESKDVLLSGNTVASCTLWGMKLYPTEVATYGNTRGFRVLGNRFENCGNSALQLAIPDSIASGNVFEGGCSVSAVQVSAENVILSDNKFTNIAGVGVNVFEFVPSTTEYGLNPALSETRTTHGVQVINNTLVDTGTADSASGVVINVATTSAGTCQRCTISGNHVDPVFTSAARASMVKAIRLASTATQCLVTNNVINGSFRIDIEGEQNIVDGNKIVGATGDAIIIDADNTAVLDNSFMGGVAPAIKVDSAGAGTVAGFQITGNRSTSGNVARTAGCSLTVNGDYNTLVSNSTSGDNIVVTGNHNTIDGNSLGDGGVDIDGDNNGILSNYIGNDQITLAASSTGNRIIGNHVMRTTLAVPAISVGANCARSLIQGNYLTDRGIESGAGCDHSSIAFNVLAGDNGALVWTGDDCTIAGNSFNHNAVTPTAITCTGNNANTSLNTVDKLTLTGRFMVVGMNLLQDDTAPLTVNPTNAAGASATDKRSLAAVTGNVAFEDIALAGGFNTATGNVVHASAPFAPKDINLDSGSDADLHTNAVVANKVNAVTNTDATDSTEHNV